MPKVENITKKMPHAVIERDDCVVVITVAEVRGLSNGSISIAEYDNPEDVARTLACIAMDALNEH